MIRYLVLALAVTGLGLWAGGSGIGTDGSTVFGQQGGSVRTGVVRLEDCNVKFIDEVDLSAERTGIIEYVAAEGTMVQSEEIVAQLRDDVPRATLAIVSKRADNDVDVRYARKASELAQLQYTRSLRANQTVPGTVSELEIREHRLAAEKALLQLEQAQNALAIEKLKHDEAEANLKSYRVVAPFSGFVRNVEKKQGEAVQEGQTILQITNTARVRVEADLPMRYLAQVKPGARVEVRPAVDGVQLPMESVSFSGRVAFVDVKVEPVSKTVKIWAEVKNRNGLLKDGVSAIMLIDPSGGMTNDE